MRPPFTFEGRGRRRYWDDPEVSGCSALVQSPLSTPLYSQAFV